MLFLSSLNPWLVGMGLNTVLLGVAFIAPKKLLTPAGLLHAWFLGVLLWGTLGWQGYVVVMFYFIVGSAVTRIGMQQKEAEGIAEKRSGARGPENVWGSALTGALCALAIGIINSGFISTPDFIQLYGRGTPPLPPYYYWVLLPVSALNFLIPVQVKLVKLMVKAPF